MNIVDITEENRNEFKGIFDEEVLISIGREYYQGIAGKDELSDETGAALIWELKGRDDEKKDTGSEILAFMAPGEEAGEEILERYRERAEYDSVKRSCFELSGLLNTEQESMENKGFELKEVESRDVLVTVGELSELPFIGKKTPPYIKSLSEITEKQFKAGIMASVIHDRFGLLEDLPFLPMSWYDRDISSCVITDGKINGLLLVHDQISGFLRVELLFAMQPDANINLLHMISHSVNTAAKLRDKNDRVILRRHNKMSLELVKKLFPDKKGEKVMRGKRDE